MQELQLRKEKFKVNKLSSLLPEQVCEHTSSSTDDVDNTLETQGDTEGPESVSEISDGGNDPTNQQSPTNAHHDDQCKN